MSRRFAFSLLVLSTVFAAPIVRAQDPDPAEVRAAAAAAWSRQNWAEASAKYGQVVASEPENGQAWHRLGYALHVQGKLDEALPAHQRATRFPQFAAVGAYNAACVHALKGDAEAAFEWLDKAASFGMGDVAQLEGDADLKSLRDDDRWQKVLARFEENGDRPQLQAFAQTTERTRSRVAWFSGNGGAGQLTIEHGPVLWNDAFAELVASPRAIGTRWRFGSDFWTSLDTSVPLQIGEVEVPAGYYYLTLVQPEAGRFVLGLHDAAAVRKAHMDASQAAQLEGGIEVPLAHHADERATDKLSIAVQLDEGRDRGHLRIALGPHRLDAPVTAKLAQ